MKIAIGVFFIFSNLLTTSSQAFTLVDPSVHAGWEGETLSFQVNESSCTGLGISASDLNTAIDEALAEWNSVPSAGIKFERGGTTASTGNTNPPTIYCSNSLTDPNTTLGVGQVGGTLYGRPISGSLALNGASASNGYFNNLGSVEKTVVVAHEIGHVLGLGHSAENSALMYYQISSKVSSRLSQDDVDALTWLHPRQEPSDGVFGCASVQTPSGGAGPGSSSNAALSFFALMFLLAMGIKIQLPRHKRVQSAI
jgi:hypothetical protein